MRAPFAGKRPVLYLIDGNAYVHRAYHALPPLTTAAGLPINAAYGFMRMLLKLLRQYHPEYVGVCFDSSQPTFRHTRFAQYKATRKAMDEDLRVQIPIVQELVDAAGLQRIEQGGYEADDLIACLATDAVRQGFDVVVVSGDKDVLQLVDEHVVVFNETRNQWMDAAAIREKYGLEPGQLVDFFALTGDASDNVPGVRGIGEKTAMALLQRFGSIDGLYAHLAEVSGNAGRLLAEQRDRAELSKELVTLCRDVPGLHPFDRERFRPAGDQRAQLIACLVKYDMRSLVGEVRASKHWRSPDQTSVSSVGEDPRSRTGDLFATIERASDASPSPTLPAGTVVIGDDAVVAELIATPVPSIIGVVLIDGNRDPFACAIMQDDADRSRTWYLPLVPHTDDQGRTVPPVSRDQFQTFFGHVLHRGRLTTYDLKTQLRSLQEHRLCTAAAQCIAAGRCDDLMIAAYALNTAERDRSLAALVHQYLGDRPVMEPRQGESVAITQYPVQRIAARVRETLGLMRELREVLQQRMRAVGVEPVYRQLDMPLIAPTASMELVGILLDREALAETRASIEERLAQLRAEIYARVGGEFNINSPKQLAHILFETLGLPAAKKKKTGYSTDEEVLLGLRDAHPVVPLVLEHRELEKLLRSYVEPLGRLVSPTDGRVRTTFNLAATATGRLSSENPNLQNIPVRTTYGRRIRALFRAAPGHLLLAADYSQIELRVLAHMSGDERLQRAFHKGEDIHSATAQEVFGVSADSVSSDLRRAAKVINFGIIYGMSAAGLSKELGIPVATAEAYIAAYFEKYAGVKAWIDRTIEETRRTGVAVTLFGRRRLVPEISSSNKAMQGFGERLAVNTPIQGTAADIIRRAMCAVWDYCISDDRHGRLLLQIHDELILEVPESHAVPVRDEVVRIMANATALTVPIVVDAHLSERWEKA